MGTPTSNRNILSELEFYLPVNPGPETRQRELTQQPTFSIDVRNGQLLRDQRF